MYNHVQQCSKQAGGDFQKAAQLIITMFKSQITNHNVQITKQAGGDLQKAAQLIITRAELGEELRPSQVGFKYLA